MSLAGVMMPSPMGDDTVLAETTCRHTRLHVFTCIYIKISKHCVACGLINVTWNSMYKIC